MLVVGIDPGKLGALAILTDAGAPLVVRAMPVITSDRGRSEYDERALRDLLDHTWAMPRQEMLVAWEQLQALPPKMGGVSANFGRGLAVGLLRGMCAGMRIRSQAYRPQEWQREMLAGTSGDDTKQRALVAASRLFPGVCTVCMEVGGLHVEHGRKTAPRDGVADALLIAEYARRKVVGAFTGAA